MYPECLRAYLHRTTSGFGARHTAVTTDWLLACIFRRGLGVGLASALADGVDVFGVHLRTRMVLVAGTVMRGGFNTGSRLTSRRTWE